MKNSPCQTLRVLLYLAQKLEFQMVRMSKQGERRAKYPRKTKNPSPKTGAKKNNLLHGFNAHENALTGDFATKAFIPKIK